MLPQVWRDRFVGWRNGLISSPQFQRWAASFPLTRPIAHKSADSLFNLVAGFVYSQVLVACVQLKLPEFLRSGPKNLDEIASTLDLQHDGARRLLQAAVALNIVELAGPNRYALGMHGAALLGNGGLADMITHHALLYSDLSDPVALLRQGGGKGQVAGFWPYAAYDNPAQAQTEAISPYSALMAATQPMISADLIDAYDFGQHRQLMDVGGGAGKFAIAVANAAPSLHVGVFDLPAVVAHAEAEFLKANLAHRSKTFGGSFLDGTLPKGADIISLIRILHDHDDAAVATLLRAAYQALPPNGTLFIGEPMSAAPTRDPMADAYFGFYLFAMGRGRARTPSEIAQMLKAAGFRSTRSIKTRQPLLARAMVARV